jgi:N,N'-diacetyllegionaminate synthase
MPTESAPVLVIAEAGVNHNGDLALAEELVQAASTSGADVVKFQTFRADRLTNKAALKARYQQENAPESQTQFDMLRSLELSDQDHRHLARLCSQLGVEFLSTGFDIEDLKFLLDIGIQRIKIPSGEITNYPLLDFVAGLGLPTIVSTGMSTMDEITVAFEILTSRALPVEKITVLQCTTAYPCPPEQVNLRVIPELSTRFNVSTGFSDHTVGIECAIGAVALGATVIEKHLTLDRGLPGPDHQASLIPSEFAEMVSGIRTVSKALGTKQKVPTDAEMENITVARRSIVAARNIAAGEVIQPDMLRAKRPGNGLSPMMWRDVIGTQALRDFSEDECVEI